MHRFFVPPEWIRGDRVLLREDTAHQVSHVLRMSPGDEVALLDGSGREYTVSLAAFARDRVEGRVLAVHEGDGAPSVGIVLYQGTLKGDRFQWVLQKGTELGVSSFVPLVCRRSVARHTAGGRGGRRRRWMATITEAAEQCGARRLPELLEPTPFKAACDAVDPSHTSIIPWEEEAATDLRRALEGPSSHRVNLFIGPEGGFEPEEVEYARRRGIAPVSLGRRILRSETAAIAAVAAVLYDRNALGH
ncbi:MAG: 16S rRNA (uracil(1498)-N(3))-methyltransferase [Dehalococcoidia bacterium]|nr:16S rRNA (uracil(1498)-N(3))-methyltransferase [Dehalococcoidia bacterium]